MKIYTPALFSKRLNISSIVACVLMTSSCSIFNMEPEALPTPQATVLNPPAVTSPQPELSDISGEKSKIKALLRNETKPLTVENVGYYMDLQYANLQQKLNGSIATLKRHESNIFITLPGALAFATNSMNINISAEKVLSIVAHVLSQYDKTLVVIEGHTDNQGNPTYNQQLSEKRALAVGEYLTEHDITINRLIIMGFGATRPIDNNQTSEGRAQNRRVEIILKPVLSEPSS